MRTNLKPDDITQELVDAVAEYLVARAFAEATRKEVDKVQRAVLENVAMYNDVIVERGLEKQRITDPDRMYLCMDEDALERFYDETDTRLRAAGLKPDTMDRDYCPALVAENDQRKAERVVISETVKLLELDVDGPTFNNNLLCAKDGLAQRQKFIDLTVGLVMSAAK